MKRVLLVLLVLLAVPGLVLAQGDEIGREDISCSEYGDMVSDDVAAVLEAINASDGDFETVYPIYALAIDLRRSHEDVAVPIACEEVNYIMRVFFGGMGDWAGHLTMQTLDRNNQERYEDGLQSGDARVDAARAAATGE